MKYLILCEGANELQIMNILLSIRMTCLVCLFTTLDRFRVTLK